MSAQVIVNERPVHVPAYTYSTCPEHDEPEEPDPLELPTEAELRSLLSQSWAAITAAEFELAKELERYRTLLNPLIAEAEKRISKDDGTQFLHRQMFADTFSAQQALSTCLRHMDFATRGAVALRNALEAKNA